ncbi:MULTISPECIES: hypothetical protein [unclassified Cedecea]|uniref:hypothetical protein n=1 Tax=unclassified Cedecea TaxID=2649846 RepID=UPI0030196E03
MARAEKIKNNRKVYEAIIKQQFSFLDRDLKQEIKDMINNCTFLGKNKVEAAEIYYIVQQSVELSESSVFYYLELYRATKNLSTPKSKSTKEKYKRVCTMLSDIIEKAIEDGRPINDMVRYRKNKQVLTAEEAQQHLELVSHEGVTLQELIDHLVSLKK